MHLASEFIAFWEMIIMLVLLPLPSFFDDYCSVGQLFGPYFKN